MFKLKALGQTKYSLAKPIYIPIHTHTDTHTHTHTHIHTHTSMCVCVCVYIYIMCIHVTVKFTLHMEIGRMPRIYIKQ